MDFELFSFIIISAVSIKLISIDFILLKKSWKAFIVNTDFKYLFILYIINVKILRCKILNFRQHKFNFCHHLLLLFGNLIWYTYIYIYVYIYIYIMLIFIHTYDIYLDKCLYLNHVYIYICNNWVSSQWNSQHIIRL